MEYCLKYSNNEIKRQLEFPFVYKSHNYIKDYNFSYNRDELHLTVALTKDLVAISKKATRSFDFKVKEDIFQKIPKNHKYIEQIIEYKSNKPIELLTVGVFIHKNTNKHSKDFSTDLFLYKDNIKKIFIENNLLLSDHSKKGFETKSYNTKLVDNNNLDTYNNNYYLKKHDNIGYYQFKTYYTKLETNYIYYNNKYFRLKRLPIYVYTEDNNIYLSERIKKLFITKDFSNIYREYIYNSIEIPGIFLYKDRNLYTNIFKYNKYIELFISSHKMNYAHINHMYLAKDIRHKHYFIEEFNSTGQLNHKKSFYIDNVLVKLMKKNFFYIWYNNLANDSNNRNVITDFFIDLPRIYDKTIYYNEFENFSIRKSYFGIYDFFINQSERNNRTLNNFSNISSDKLLAERTLQEIWIDEQLHSFKKESSSIIKNNDKFFAYRKTPDIYLNSRELLVFRERYAIIRGINELFVYKKTQIPRIQGNFDGGIKEKYLINTNFQDDYYFLLKEGLPSILFGNNKYTIISANKNKNSIFLNELLKLLKNNKRFERINKDTTGSKIGHTIFSENIDFYCDKLSKRSNIMDYFNISAFKAEMNINFISSDIYVNKDKKRTLLNELFFGIKAGKKSDILKNITFLGVTKDKKNIFRKEIENARKKIKNTDFHVLDNLININKVLKGVRIYKLEWFYNYKLIYMNQDIPLSKDIRNTLRYNEQDSFEKLLSTDIFEELQSLEIQKIINVFKTEFGKKLDDPKNMSVIQSYLLDQEKVIQEVDDIYELAKIIKEGHIIANNISDWAWVWEEDEPFDDPYKIDELLLPENDTRYEDFENIIFNREIGKPRNPIKIIDDNTFIAKFPNHYPIKEKDNKTNAYENIAIEYLDVRTCIMRQVFLGYYKIWQDKIFEFSRMTIPQSAKKMLDYLYAWILMYFSEEDIPEALRSFRLVRWYLERAIIEDSEYYISYTPDDLTSGKLDTTNLAIPNNLKDNNSMYIDTKNHIIRNNPDKLNREAKLELYIDNKFDTKISFSLHTMSTTYIMLNGEEIDKITLPFNSKLVYNIPYNEDGNVFTIMKKEEDNTDKEFFIGNIIINNMGTTGELDIEFNPKIQGNKSLSHVSKKIMNYINLYESNEDLIKSLLKGNVHISDVYQELLTYWEIHHEGKTKGKRLTIKRT